MAFPGTYNFNYYRGDTFQFIVRPKDANGDQFDLDGYTAGFTIASSRGATPQLSILLMISLPVQFLLQ